MLIYSQANGVLLTPAANTCKLLNRQRARRSGNSPYFAKSFRVKAKRQRLGREPRNTIHAYPFAETGS